MGFASRFTVEQESWHCTPVKPALQTHWPLMTSHAPVEPVGEQPQEVHASFELPAVPL